MACAREEFESSVKEKDHQTTQVIRARVAEFESSVKEKDHQTGDRTTTAPRCLRAV